VAPSLRNSHVSDIKKKAFEDIGKYSDSILMGREEKKSLKELVKHKLKDKGQNKNKGDEWILNLNRLLIHQLSDFRNGIWFTLGVTIVFGLLTLVFTEEFQRHFCWGCEFDKDTFFNGVKFFF
jgi:CRISPR/Cas system CSM-associated protein Csm4 (group 5 of RAMP superfamily)